MENKKLKFRLAFQVVDENDEIFRGNMSFQECLEIPLSYPANKMKHDHFCDIKEQMVYALETIVKSAQTNYLFVSNTELIPEETNANTAHKPGPQEIEILCFGSQIVAQGSVFGYKTLLPHKIRV